MIDRLRAGLKMFLATAPYSVNARERMISEGSFWVGVSMLYSELLKESVSMNDEQYTAMCMELEDEIAKAVIEFARRADRDVREVTH